MTYVSTRGTAPKLDFAGTLLAGLASDGGLFVPETYPHLSPAQIAGFSGLPYARVAEAVMAPFVGAAIAPAALRAMIESAYAGFRHKAVAPLTQIDTNLFVLELFHGPTLAFKDVAMQLLGRLMAHVLAARGQRATIIAATSGDTGAAAIEAFRGLDRVDVFVLYPKGRVSDVQRRQMTTVDAQNVHVIALDGTFDDAQAIVKALFGHAAFREEVGLSGVNSINWARVMAQAVYYFTSAVALGSPHRKMSFAVPTGNFGDILAGWIAKRMGLPIERLVVATNLNDILVRALETGSYAVTGVQATQSPSMDIQVSSNFERLLFEAYARDAAAVARLMAGLQQSRDFSIAEMPLEAIRAEFDAARVDEAQTTAEIARVWRETGVLIDPHGAVGVAAGRRIAAKDPATPMIVLGTAHPAKFPDAVARAIGAPPPMPDTLAALFDRPERETALPNDTRRIAEFIRAHVKHAAGAVS